MDLLNGRGGRRDRGGGLDELLGGAGADTFSRVRAVAIASKAAPALTGQIDRGLDQTWSTSACSGGSVLPGNALPLDHHCTTV
jgi:hypothetical protein